MNPVAGAPSVPIPSATVVMLRDAPQGLEVFLLRRHGLSDVLGGAYVFPGGKLDPADLELADRLDQPLEALHSALGEPDISQAQAAALHAAAIREVFEEAGVLFAALDADRAREAARLLAEGQAFNQMLKTLDLALDTSSLAPWSRWITPLNSLNMHKRFDARFFVAAVPPGQEPVHDMHEATESVWLSPRAALQQYWERQIELAPPQIMTLAHIARHPDVAAVLAEARSRQPPCILPQVFDQDGVKMVGYPGDEQHPVAARAMPGPTRLVWRDKRFEPQGGLESLFD